MTVASQGKPAKLLARVVYFGLSVVWTLAIAMMPNLPPETPWWWLPFFGMIGAGFTILIGVILLRMMGVGGFLAFSTFVIGSILWISIGPVPTIIIGGGIAYLLWRYRVQIGRRFGLQVPERAASSADTSSAAASNQDSNSGTVN